MIERHPQRDLDGPELVELVAALAREDSAWRDLVRHDSGQRVYEEILHNPHLSVWLICWMDEQDTGFHDHDLSSGAVAVVAGAVREERLVLGGPPAASTFASGQSFYFNASAIHRVHHVGRTPAVTIHAYSPPLQRMGAYSVGPRGELVRETVPYTDELRPSEEPLPNEELRPSSEGLRTGEDLSLRKEPRSQRVAA
jgi:predicted metal-dependent enzyme (double-stranded beta helix superfamily)